MPRNTFKTKSNVKCASHPLPFPTSLIGKTLQRKWVLVNFKTNLHTQSSARHTMSQLHIVCSCREIVAICKLKIPCKAGGLAGVCSSDGEPSPPQSRHHNGSKGKSLWSPNQMRHKIDILKVKYDSNYIYTVYFSADTRWADLSIISALVSA